MSNLALNEINNNTLLNKKNNESINEINNNKLYSRKLCSNDLLDNNKNYSNSELNIIQKNQQEFGHKKRIKP